jgi:rhomboid family GlyGly-CTERM serine protease
MTPSGASGLRGADLVGPAPLVPSLAGKALGRSVALLRRGGLTAILCSLALLAFVLPGAEAVLAYDRTALAAGEGWRLLTGHLVHWSADHLLWDVATFAVLGALCEMRGRRRFALCVVAAALAIPAFLWWGLPGMERYGGLSGIDSALFALLGASMLAENWRRDGGRAVALAAALAAAFAFKIGFELIAGQPLFAADLGPGVAPAPLAHCAGAAAGLLCAVRWRDPGSREPTAPLADRSHFAAVTSGTQRGAAG